MSPSAQLKAFAKGLATLAVATVLFFLIYDSVIHRVIPFIRLKLVETNIVTPDLPEPNIPSPPIVEEKENSLELLASPYIPTNDPFSSANYARVPKIIYQGKFDKVSLYVGGEVTSSTPVLIMFNYGNEAGFAHGYRREKNKIDISETRRRGGLFESDDNIDLNINLLGDELASSSDFFEQTTSPTHFIKFIMNDNSPDSANLIAIPVDLSGGYGGATITSMMIKYTCSKDSDCSIYDCQGSAYSCMLDKYKKKVADEWWAKYQSRNPSQ